MEKIKTLFKNNLIFSVIIIIGIFLYYRTTSQSTAYTKTSKLVMEQKVSQFKDMVMSRKILCLNNIIGDNAQNKLILLYSASDCRSCIKEGFEIIKAIDSTISAKRTAVISSGSDIAYDKISFNYKKNIYEDNKQLLRNELQYIATPILIVVDEAMVVKDAYFPTIYDSDDDVDSFLRSITTKLTK